MDKVVVLELGKEDFCTEPVPGDFLNMDSEGLGKALVAWDLGKENFCTELALVDI